MSRAVNVDEKEVALRHRISIWVAIRRIYMPCVNALRPASIGEFQGKGGGDEDATTYATTAADVKLHFPESLTSNLRSQLPSKLLAKYWRLRLAQVDDVLASMKRHLWKGGHSLQNTKKTTPRGPA